MESTYQFLLALGGILILGLTTTAIGHRTFLPRVTLLLIFGVIIGKQMLDIIPSVFSGQFEIVTDMALLMVGFLIGGKLTKNSLAQMMDKVLWISISAAIITTVFVSLALVWIGLSTQLAILLGSIAAATAPAAILDVVLESKQNNPFSNLLISIVALDDAWALMLFGIGVAVATSISGNGTDNLSILMAIKDIGGAVILGVLIGFPAAYLTGRLKDGEPILSEALGLVFVCGGLAIWLDVSFLITAIVMGAVVANFAKHHEYPFHAIEGIESPFMVTFFVLAGASLDFNGAGNIALILVVYIISRIAGKLIGARFGAQFSQADQKTKKWMGVALLPQAGVAIGMALVASNYFPEYRQILLSVVISSTIFFEIIGPIFTRLALKKACTD
jgi:Kef-type K+ transport system membrane component KefB